MSAQGAEPDTDLVSRRELRWQPLEVLAAFLEPGRLARWWGPAGFANEFDLCEPRPGGDWRFTMVGPNGARYRNESRFLELGPHRVVIQHLSAPRYVLTVSLEACPAGTRLEWRQRFESADMVRRVAAVAGPGNEQNLDRLAAELERSGG